MNGSLSATYPWGADARAAPEIAAPIASGLSPWIGWEGFDARCEEMLEVRPVAVVDVVGGCAEVEVVELDAVDVASDCVDSSTASAVNPARFEWDGPDPAQTANPTRTASSTPSTVKTATRPLLVLILTTRSQSSSHATWHLATSLVTT